MSSPTSMPAPPPLPPNMPPEIVFQYDLAKWSTSTLYDKLDEVQRTVAEDEAEGPSGALAGLGAWVRGLPMAVQVAIAVAFAQVLLNVTGVVLSKYGVTVPQVTVPATVEGPVEVRPVGAHVVGTAAASTDKEGGADDTPVAEDLPAATVP
jgi:hypothetical protein